MSNTNVGYIQFYIQFYLSFQCIISIKRWLVRYLHLSQTEVWNSQWRAFYNRAAEAFVKWHWWAIRRHWEGTGGMLCDLNPRSKQAGHWHLPLELSSFSSRPRGVLKPPWRNTASTVSSSHLLKLFTVTGWVMVSCLGPDILSLQLILICDGMLPSTVLPGIQRGGEAGEEAGKPNGSLNLCFCIILRICFPKNLTPKIWTNHTAKQPYVWLTTVWGSTDPPHPRSKPPAKDWL